MRGIGDLLKSRVFWIALVVVACLPFLALFAFNWWFTISAGWGLFLTCAMTLALAGSVISVAISSASAESFDGSQFVEKLKASKLLGAMFTLIGYFMIVRLWWAIAVPRITGSFISTNYWQAMLVASVVLILITSALAGFLSKFSSGKGKKPFFGMMAVAAIATLLAFTSDNTATKYFSTTEASKAMAVYCQNDKCPNPDETRVFFETTEKESFCSFCGEELKKITAEVAGKHVAAIKESKGHLLPFGLSRAGSAVKPTPTPTCTITISRDWQEAFLYFEHGDIIYVLLPEDYDKRDVLLCRLEESPEEWTLDVVVLDNRLVGKIQMKRREGRLSFKQPEGKVFELTVYKVGEERLPPPPPEWYTLADGSLTVRLLEGQNIEKVVDLRPGEPSPWFRVPTNNYRFAAAPLDGNDFVYQTTSGGSMQVVAGHPVKLPTHNGILVARVLGGSRGSEVQVTISKKR